MQTREKYTKSNNLYKEQPTNLRQKQVKPNPGQMKQKKKPPVRAKLLPLYSKVQCKQIKTVRTGKATDEESLRNTVYNPEAEQDKDRQTLILQIKTTEQTRQIYTGRNATK